MVLGSVIDREKINVQQLILSRLALPLSVDINCKSRKYIKNKRQLL